MRRDIEADLVVALAGAAVGDRVGALALGDLDEELRDQRPGEGRRQRIGALVQGVGLEVRPDVVGHEPLARVDHVGARGAGRHRPILDAGPQRPAAQVDRQGHDLDAELFLEPGDGDRRVETTRIREDDLVHGILEPPERDWIDSNRSRQRSRRDVVGEQDEERIVARQRPFLLAQARLVDRLGDDAGRAGRPGQHQDQPAAPDRDRDVAEDPHQPLIRGRASRWRRPTRRPIRA